MKIYTIGGALTAQAETVQDVEMIMAMRMATELVDKHGVDGALAKVKSNEAGYPAKRGKYKTRKANYKKPCDICGQPTKGLLGQSIHVIKHHPDYRWDRELKVAIKKES